MRDILNITLICAAVAIIVAGTYTIGITVGWAAHQRSPECRCDPHEEPPLEPSLRAELGLDPKLELTDGK